MYIRLLRKVENELHLLGDEWENFARDNLNSSVRTLHFVKEGENTFYVTGFNRHRIEWQGYNQLVIDCCWHYFATMAHVCMMVIVFPSMLMLPARTKPSYAINDKKAKHFCSWVGHICHYTKDDVFYTILNAPVYDKYQLTVPVEYSVAHELDKYYKAVVVHDDVRYTMALELIADRIRPGRRSHVKMTGN
nr:DNA-binding pseudobarrel domain-containing protein [Tanacetum cinerariifolium]